MGEVFEDILWCIAVFFLAFLPAYIFEKRIKDQSAAPVPEARRVSALRTSQLHQNCVICFSPANSRCSWCKDVNYCSRKCQIIHWRQGHNKKCQSQTSNSSGVAAAGLTPQQMPYLHESKSQKNVALDETSDKQPNTQTNKKFNMENGGISRSQEDKFRNEGSRNTDSSFSPISEESVCILQNEQDHKAVRSILDEWNQPIKNLVKATELAKYAFEQATKVRDTANMAYHDKPTPAVSVKGAEVPKASFQICRTCFAPASTRCSQCKSVHYCSGKCQIAHWREGHREKCQPLSPSPIAATRPKSPNKPPYSIAQSICVLQNLQEQKSVRSIPEEWNKKIRNLVKATEMAKYSIEQGSKVRVKAHMACQDKHTSPLPVKVAKEKVPAESEMPP